MAALQRLPALGADRESVYIIQALTQPQCCRGQARWKMKTLLAVAGGEGPSAEWREEAGRQNAVVGTLGRVFDLIVLERPSKLASLAEATLEDALFESGRPVLMAPPAPLGTIGERVLVAWNGS